MAVAASATAGGAPFPPNACTRWLKTARRFVNNSPTSGFSACSQLGSSNTDRRAKQTSDRVYTAFHPSSSSDTQILPSFGSMFGWNDLALSRQTAFGGENG